MTSAPRPFIKICGMTTPVAVSTAMACEVDAIGFVFATSVRQVTTQRAAELAAPARGKIACVAVTRHPTRELILEILRDFRPDILQTDIDDIAGLDLPATLPVLPVMRPGPQAACALPGASAVRRAGEWQRSNYRLGRRRAACPPLRNHPGRWPESAQRRLRDAPGSAFRRRCVEWRRKCCPASRVPTRSRNSWPPRVWQPWS